jgi:hypothetical protein
MPDLDHELRAARAGLLRQIEVPELTGVRARARRIRRRRRGLGAAAAALALLGVVGTASAVLRDAGDGRGAPVASAPATDVPSPVWRSGGLTVLGLNGPVTDLPGTITDVVFVDADRGVVLATECEGSACALALAVTVDRGHTWAFMPTPLSTAPSDRVPRLVQAGSGVALVGDEAWYTPFGSVAWSTRDLGSMPAVDSIAPGGTLWLDRQQGGCEAGPLLVWQPDGTPGQLARQPEMSVCRATSVPAADGAWWVGGVANGVAAVGVSRDAGASWEVTPLPAAEPGAWAEVSPLGSEVFATVVGPWPGSPDPRTVSVRAVYRSVGGGDFEPYAAEIGTVTGELVPLLDGRLVAASPRWFVAAGPGQRLQFAGEALPYVLRLQRTAAGWVAYNMFEAGWVAISSDGQTWQKLNVR